VITDLSNEEAKSRYTIFCVLEELKYDYDIISIKIDDFSKSKQLILSQCDKNNDTLIIMFETTAFVHVEKILTFIYITGFTYTGVNPYYYDHSRNAMKQYANFAGIKTPKTCFIYSLTSLEEQINNNQMVYPLFVKTEASYNSLGIDKNSKVNTFEELYKQVSIVLEKYGGVLVEEFIDGIEVSCLVYGDINYRNCLDPVKYNFNSNDNFLTNADKCEDDCEYWYEHVTDTKIIEKCKEASLSLFKSLNITGFFRIDFRLSNDTLFMLEYNSYPSFFETCGSTVQTILKCNNMTESDFLTNVMLKYKIYNGDTTEQRYNEDTGYGLYSTRVYNIGDTISDRNLTDTIELLNINSSKYKANAEIYKNFAYNINSDTIAVWSSNPENFKAINHSCEPNALYSNLKLTALKTIHPNDEIFIDYNTFCVDFKFECNCNNSCCKKNITCNDYNSFSFKNEYSDDQVSPYILMLQHYNQLIKILNNNNKINVKYDRTTNSFYIVAGEDISENELVLNLDKNPIIQTNNKYAITKNLLEYYDTETSLLQYTNHSCKPNIVITSDGSNFIAKTKINKGEMITFNYNTTEYEVIRPFDCLCMNDCCLKRIRGFKYLSLNQQNELSTNYECSPFIKSCLKENNII